MGVSPELLDAAVAAIRRSGGGVNPIGDCWITKSGATCQIFVTEAPESLSAGQAYTTWVVSLGADGTVSRVEQFRSTACRPRAVR
jgi:hypothetical protein